MTLVLRRIHFSGTAKPVPAENKSALHFSCVNMRKKQKYSEVSFSMNLSTAMKTV